MAVLTGRTLGVVMIFAAGCGTSAFDDIRDQAWSDSRSQPENVESARYPVAMATVDRGQLGATIAVAGDEPATLTTMSYDADGRLRQSGIELGGAFARKPVVTGAEDAVATIGLVALAGLEAGTVRLFNVRTGLEGPEPLATVSLSECPDYDGAEVSALRFARTALGSPMLLEMLVVAGSQLLVLSDIDPGTAPACMSCTLRDPSGELATGVDLTVIDVGDLDQEGLAVSIAGGDDVSGSVWSLDPSLIIQGMDCDVASTTTDPLLPIEVDPSFGARIAAGDFDADEATDLAIASSEGESVTIILDVGDNPDRLVVAAPAGADGFGAQLVFGDFDGEDGDELVVASPDASQGNVQRAGLVTVYRLGDQEADLLASLWDSSPVTEQRFGQFLSIAEFIIPQDDADLLVVGADSEVFTYFVVVDDPEVDDPRFE